MFFAYEHDGRWFVVPEQYTENPFDHPRVCSVSALCHEEPASPIPLLLPITKSIRCDINLSPSLQGETPGSKETVVIRSLVTQSLNADPRWAGLPTSDGQRIRMIAWVELIGTVTVFLCWLFARWITIWLVASSGVQHLGRATCGTCGYPLHDLDSHTCPECSTPFGEPPNPA